MDWTNPWIGLDWIGLDIAKWNHVELWSK